MRTIQETITGNYSMAVSGRYFRILSSDNPVDLSFFRRGRMDVQALQIGAGYWTRFDEPFDRVDVVGVGMVKMAVAEADGGYDVLSINGDMPVKPATSTTLVEATTTVGTAAAGVLGASATRREVRFYNAGTADIYLGGSGITTSGALCIKPGQLWIEDTAAAAAWYAISTAAAQSLRIQAVMP